MFLEVSSFAKNWGQVEEMIGDEKGAQKGRLFYGRPVQDIYIDSDMAWCAGRN